MSSGILLLDKPLGLSSNTALQCVRRLFDREKAGHVGSLDPLASGMLPICLGEATKIAGEILALRKCYRFTIVLGARTATGDAEGEVVETAPVPALEGGVIDAVLSALHGTQQQTPPMYSAIKQKGQPLYRLARAGLTVERAARTIELFGLWLLQRHDAALDLKVLCSKGTYVRVLAEDIARALGTVGHVGALRRLYVEPFEAFPMQTLEQLEAARHAEQAIKPIELIPMDRAVLHLPAVDLTAVDAQRIRHGQAAGVRHGMAGRVRLYGPGAEFLGIGAVDAAGEVRPKRLLTVSPGTRQ
ncbi:MAG: tRNA pseudouridine(55) synthase TruB [Proteobacteria bacterium]|nr:tRNA pseudouridine(55) synthase TruB [Pseudomonadota bacterium]